MNSVELYGGIIPKISGITITDTAGVRRSKLPLHLEGIVDTGASATVIPIEIAEDIGYRTGEEREYRDFANRAIMLQTFWVMLIHPQLGNVIVKAVGCPGVNGVLIGRDIFHSNKLALAIDWHRKTWAMGKRSHLSRFLTKLLPYALAKKVDHLSDK